MQNLLNAEQFTQAAFQAFKRNQTEIWRAQGKPEPYHFTLERGKGAAVDWREDTDFMQCKLMLPVFKPGARFTRQQADAMAGYWVHETIHPTYTDDVAWGAACKMGAAFRHMVNALEDVRAEKLLIDAKSIPNAQDVLTTITENVVWSEPITHETVNDPKNLAVVCCYLGRARNGYDLPRAKDMRRKLTAKNLAFIDEILDKLMPCKSTGDVVALVRQIFNHKLESQQDAGEQEGAESGAQDAGAQEGTGAGPDMTKPEFGGDMADPDASDVITKIADAMAGGHETQSILESAADRPVIDCGNAVCSTVYTRKLAKVSGINALKGHVKRMVRSPDRFGWVNRLDTGRFDPKAAPRVRTGSGDYFRKADNQDGHKTAVAILCDLSYSMASTLVPQAVMACHVAQAVEAAHCPVEIYAFKTGCHTTRIKRANANMKKHGPRVYKSLTPSTRELGGTPLAASIVTVAHELAAADATHKLLIVLTDGQGDTGRRGTELAIRIAQATEPNFRVVGVVMGSCDPEQYGFDVADASVGISDFDNLSGGVLKTVADELEKDFNPRRAA